MPKLAAQPAARPSAASNSSTRRDLSYIFLVDTGMPPSLTRSPFVSGGFGLSSSTILLKRGAGRNVVSREASGHRQGVPLNRWNSAGPATDSLDHRARP